MRSCLRASRGFLAMLAVSVGGSLCAAACGETGAAEDDGASDAAPDAAPGPDAALPDATPGPDAAPPDAAPPDAAPPTPPSCAAAFAYDPLAGARLESFPDDFYTRPDPASATGLRPDFSPERAPWVPQTPGDYDVVFEQLALLDGFGTTAGIILRFTGPVAAPEAGAVRLVELPAGGAAAVEIPFEVATADEGATLILWPVVPLRAATRHGVVVTSALRAADGGCVAPAPTVTALLASGADAPAGLDPRLAPLAPRYAELKSGVSAQGVSAADLVGAVVFTTQSITGESEAIAADIAGRPFAFDAPPTCVDEALFRVCEATFEAGDYRDAAGIVAAGPPQRTYRLPVRLWLPLEAAPPYPVTIFGHGLGGDRGQATALAEVAAPLGMATVAIDAPSHGDHPTADPSAPDLLRIAAFFGVDLTHQRLDALTLRDHWREATYDKLQLLRALATLPELDVSRLSYFGVSLGGIMGSELLALSPDVGAAILSVPGARVSSIVSDSPTFSFLVRAMTPPGTPPGEVARFFPVLQTLLERGDAGNYAPHVLRDRLPVAAAGGTPSLLFAMAMDDQIVPNVCNRALARALRIEQMAPVFAPVGPPEVNPPAPAAPVRGNLADGQATAALFQFDRITPRGGGAVEPAAHDNVSASAEGILQATRFLSSWQMDGVGEIVDPYGILGTGR